MVDCGMGWTAGTHGKVIVAICGLYMSCLFYCSKTHHKKTRHFWWQHGADRNQLQNMLLFDQELQNFKKKVVKAMDELEESKSKTLQEVIVFHFVYRT